MSSISKVDFTTQPVANKLPDGYWLEAFPFKTTGADLPDLVGYGLGTKEKASPVLLYKNPRNPGESFLPPTGWGRTAIQTLDFPVSMTYADLTGDGYNDIIICDRYGPSMEDLWDAETNDGGRVLWLQNPGSRSSKDSWVARPIGNSTGMHRLKAGHFTRTDVTQVLAIPIISISNDLDSPSPIIIYTPEYSNGIPSKWNKDVPFPTQFHLIHEIKVLKNSHVNGLDSFLVAGREGIVYFWYDVNGEWNSNVVGYGVERAEGNPYWGSGSVDVGRVGDDPIGFIAATEAFHGNVVSLYAKSSSAPKGLDSLKDGALWTRWTLKPGFGPLNDKHTGTIHHVECGDIIGSDKDCFVIACIGEPESNPDNKGMYLYHPNDNFSDTGSVARYKISNESAGRVAIVGLNSPSLLDAASISYYVPGYHTGPDPPSIRILTLSGNTDNLDPSASTITVTRLVKEALIKVPRPKAILHQQHLSMPLIEIAGRRLHIVVLAPGITTSFGLDDGVKVIYGTVNFDTFDGTTVSREISTPPHEVATTAVLSLDGSLTAGPDGAVVVRFEYLSDHAQGPYSAMNQLPTTNAFPDTTPLDVRALPFDFHKVETLDWAKETGFWNGFEFYNLSGFHIFFSDDALDKICHVQLWTLGIGETARFHKHSDKPFCEIHMCIANGGGSAGMRYWTSEMDEAEVRKHELEKKFVEDNSNLIVVPPMSEHGPLWRIQEGTVARPKLLPNGTADYPWHSWIASEFGDYKIPITPPLDKDKQKYDVWTAFEFPLLAFQE